MSRIKNKEPFPEKVLKFIGDKSLEFLDLSFKLMFDPEEIIKKYSFSYSYAPRAVYNLKKSPYFKYENNKFYVTERGRIKIIKNILKNRKHQKLGKSWLGIIFDIPEASRRDRDFLRKELNMAGCKELQKSVWVTPFDIEKELSVLLKLWKKDFMGDIRFLKIDQMSGEEEIKKYFKIK